jgi:hypothetical protein
MKHRPTIATIAVFFVFIFAALLFWPSPAKKITVFAQQNATEAVDSGGGEFVFLPKDEITAEQRAEIMRRIENNIEKLKKEGKIAEASPQAVPLSWPVAKKPGLADFNVDGISNFVDQNPAFPNQRLDYNCGNRTYDLDSGYNHAGLDIFSWPFGWKKMDNNEVEVVAAAPGTIVFKSDGNFDRNCGFGSGNWNAVYVRHADNSVAWYGHLKNGTATTKPVGATVAAGEKLGVVGSSGNSTGPHLHFELYNAANQLQDPFQGPCNTLNNFSWWAQQPAYRVAQINKLATQSAPPVFPSCPQTETTNEKNVFKRGETLVTAAYLRDQQAAQQTQYSILRPDGSVFQSWNHNSPNTYNASFWWWQWTIPSNAPAGAWKLRAVFNSQTYEHTFFVGPSAPFDFDGDARADISVYRPADGVWYLSRSQAGFAATQFGIAADLTAPADFDGDRKTDIAVFRAGVWYLLRSTEGFAAAQFGSPGDLPRPADYDGDGKADIAVFRPSSGTWFIIYSGSGQFAAVQFGTNGDIPVPADFDGDTKADINVFRPSNGNWYRLNSGSGQFIAAQFGVGEDFPVPADFDGDNRADIAVFRPSIGTWFRLNSSTGAFVAQQFGTNGDIPAAADFDGDAKADIAVFRPNGGHWFRLNSSNGEFIAGQFGAPGDQPVPSSFIR